MNIYAVKLKDTDEVHEKQVLCAVCTDAMFQNPVVETITCKEVDGVGMCKYCGVFVGDISMLSPSTRRYQ